MAGPKKSSCHICGAEIPRLTREKLMDMGYSGIELGGRRSKDYQNWTFCPKHEAEEIAAALSDYYKSLGKRSPFESSK